MSKLSPAGCQVKGRNDSWATPQHVFDILNKEFGFTLDVCADVFNYKCANFLTKEQDGLTKSWKHNICFCNPPYSDIGPWVKKAHFEAEFHQVTTVLLIPPRIDQWYWHEHIIPYGAEVRYWKGRIQFVPPDGVKASTNSTGSCIVIFRPKD